MTLLGPTVDILHLDSQTDQASDRTKHQFGSCDASQDHFARMTDVR